MDVYQALIYIPIISAAHFCVDSLPYGPCTKLVPRCHYMYNITLQFIFLFRTGQNTTTDIGTVSVFNTNNSFRHLEITWIPMVRECYLNIHIYLCMHGLGNVPARVGLIYMKANYHVLWSFSPHPQESNATMYAVRVASDGTYIGQGRTICNASPCFYVHNITTLNANIIISVASIHVPGAESSEPMNSAVIGCEL